MYRAIKVGFKFLAAFVGLIAIGVSQAIYGWAGDAMWLRILYPAACFAMALVCLGLVYLVARGIIGEDDPPADTDPGKGDWANRSNR